VESTVPTTATTAPASSPMPTAVAPSSASQFATSAPSSFQVAPQAPVAVPQAPQAYQTAVAPQASAPVGNPWQDAFQALSASLNTPQASQAPAQYSAYQTPTPQASTQAAWASQAPMAAPTYAPQASTQGYSAQEVQALLHQQQAQILSQVQSQGASDGYLSGISDVSLEVLEHFGSEAPALLNNYACAVEDALIEQVGRNQSMNLMLDAASEERAAMNTMLTDPDVLADYVTGFYGPNGPYPTETAEETAIREDWEARQQFEYEIAQQEQRAVPPNFQRPEMDMPTPGRAQAPQRSFWGDFSSMMDNNPEQAWQFLSGAPAQAFQSKMLVQDY
jgi:hypothetical protein